MREWCGCGAGIAGKPKHVKAWRQAHRHPAESVPEQPGHPPTSGGSQVEHAWQGIGFRPDET